MSDEPKTTIDCKGVFDYIHKDTKFTRAEFQYMLTTLADTNGDGKLDRNEATAFFQTYGNKTPNIDKIIDGCSDGRDEVSTETFAANYWIQFLHATTGGQKCGKNVNCSNRTYNDVSISRFDELFKCKVEEKKEEKKEEIKEEKKEEIKKEEKKEEKIEEKIEEKKEEKKIEKREEKIEEKEREPKIIEKNTHHETTTIVEKSKKYGWLDYVNVILNGTDLVVDIFGLKGRNNCNTNRSWLGGLGNCFGGGGGGFNFGNSFPQLSNCFGNSGALCGAPVGNYGNYFGNGNYGNYFGNRGYGTVDGNGIPQVTQQQLIPQDAVAVEQKGSNLYYKRWTPEGLTTGIAGSALLATNRQRTSYTVKAI